MNIRTYQGVRQSGKTYQEIQDFISKYQSGKVLILTDTEEESKKMCYEIINAIGNMTESTKYENAIKITSFIENSYYTSIGSYLQNIKDFKKNEYEHVLVDCDMSLFFKEILNAKNLSFTRLESDLIQCGGLETKMNTMALGDLFNEIDKSNS